MGTALNLYVALGNMDILTIDSSKMLNLTSY